MFAFFVLNASWNDFGSILTPFWLPFGLLFVTFFHNKCISKSTSNVDAFLIAVSTTFDSILRPAPPAPWGPARDPHRTRTLFFRPPSPLLLQAAIQIHFGSLLDRFWLHFLNDFGSIFVRFWIDFSWIFSFQLVSQNLLKDAQKHSTFFQFSAQARWRVRSLLRFE